MSYSNDPNVRDRQRRQYIAENREIRQGEGIGTRILRALGLRAPQPNDACQYEPITLGEWRRQNPR